MALFGLFFLVGALVPIGIGVAVSLVVCGAAAALIGLGIFSSSLVIGILNGRPAAAARAFLVQCGILAGALTGAVCAWLGQAFFTTHGSSWGIFVFGALGGAVAGLVGTLFLELAFRRLSAWVAIRI